MRPNENLCQVELVVADRNFARRPFNLPRIKKNNRQPVLMVCPTRSLGNAAAKMHSRNVKRLSFPRIAIESWCLPMVQEWGGRYTKGLGFVALCWEDQDMIGKAED